MQELTRDRRVAAGWIVAAASLVVLSLAGALFVAADLTWDAVAVGEFILSAALVVTGILVITHQPRNLFGWTTMATGTFVALTLLAATFGYHQLRQEPDGAYYRAAMWLSCWLWVPAVTFPALNYSIFPNGHLRSKRWIWVPVVAVVGGTITAVAIATIGWQFRGPLLLYGPGWLPQLEPLPGAAKFGLGLLAVALLGSVLTMTRRMVKSAGDERRQYKWLAYSGVLSVATLLVSLWAGSSVPTAMAMGGLFAPPGVFIAIFKYRLYDIDHLINRTVVYGLVTGALLLAYGMGTIFVGAAARTLTADVPSETVVAVSTLAVAALFRPVRSRSQELIDRRFYRRKYDAAVTIERFTKDLREEVDLEHLTGHLLQVIEETMQPEEISLWLRPASDPSPA